MTGNVAEWVNDWYQADYYSVSPGSNPLGPDTGTTKVQRGGSWDNSTTRRNDIALRRPARLLLCLPAAGAGFCARLLHGVDGWLRSGNLI
jgi:hypothetical protein